MQRTSKSRADLAGLRDTLLVVLVAVALAWAPLGALACSRRARASQWPAWKTATMAIRAGALLRYASAMPARSVSRQVLQARRRNRAARARVAAAERLGDADSRCGRRIAANPPTRLRHEPDPFDRRARAALASARARAPATAQPFDEDQIMHTRKLLGALAALALGAPRRPRLAAPPTTPSSRSRSR